MYLQVIDQLSWDVSGSRIERTDKQKAHEDSTPMDEGEAEAKADMQPYRPT